MKEMRGEEGKVGGWEIKGGVGRKFFRFVGGKRILYGLYFGFEGDVVFNLFLVSCQGEWN